MAITSRIHEELFVPTTDVTESGDASRSLVRMPLTRPRGDSVDPTKAVKRRRHRRNSTTRSQQALAWSADEHERFLRGLERFPRGPWKEVAYYVGTRTVRQTMTHAQKYREKIARRKRKLEADAVCKTTSPSAVAGFDKSPMLDASFQPLMGFDAITMPPSESVPAFQNVRSPSSMERFAFGTTVSPAESVMWHCVALGTAVSPLSPPPMLGPIDYLVADGAVEPLAFDESDMDFLLDAVELDSLVVDDVFHSVIAQHLEPCPINDSYFGTTA